MPERLFQAYNPDTQQVQNLEGEFAQQYSIRRRIKDLVKVETTSKELVRRQQS